MNNLNQSNKNIKILLHSFRLKTYPRLTLIVGLGAKAQIFPFSLHILGPRPKSKEIRDEVDFGCHLIFTHRISMQYSSCFHATSLQNHFFLLSSLILGHKHTHTPQISHKSSLDHSRTSLPLHSKISSSRKHSRGNLHKILHLR